MNQLQYCQQQLSSLYQQLKDQPAFQQDSLDDNGLKFIQTLESLCQGPQGEDYYEQGQWLISQAVANFPQLTPIIPRDLFWHFGGDCLHYMPDEEIAQFQALEEALYQQSPDPAQANYQEERAKVFGLH